METFAKIVFLLMICLSPLGILLFISLTRAARKQLAAHNEQAALRLRTRARKYLTSGLIDLLIGPLGYYLISRRVFPQIDPVWVFTLMLPSAFVHLWFSGRLNSIARRNPS